MRVASNTLSRTIPISLLIALQYNLYQDVTDWTTHEPQASHPRARHS